MRRPAQQLDPKPEIKNKKRMWVESAKYVFHMSWSNGGREIWANPHIMYHDPGIRRDKLIKGCGFGNWWEVEKRRLRWDSDRAHSHSVLTGNISFHSHVFRCLVTVTWPCATVDTGWAETVKLQRKWGMLQDVKIIIKFYLWLLTTATQHKGVITPRTSAVNNDKIAKQWTNLRIYFIIVTLVSCHGNVMIPNMTQTII